MAFSCWYSIMIKRSSRVSFNNTYGGERLLLFTSLKDVTHTTASTLEVTLGPLNNLFQFRVDISNVTCTVDGPLSNGACPAYLYTINGTAPAGYGPVVRILLTLDHPDGSKCTCRAPSDV